MRSFAGYPFIPYIGQFFALPIRIGTLAGFTAPLLIRWGIYGAATAVPNIAVKCDLSVLNVATTLGAIRSCYIDNMASDVPVYVQFPSTGYTVVAQPNSAGWFPVYTGDLQVTVAGSGFITGDIPTTLILLTNIPIPASVDLEIQQSTQLWLASNTISRGNTIYNTNLGTPALGDQTINYFDTPGANVVFRNNLWGTPLSSGFIYLTHVDIKLVYVLAAGTISWVLESTGIAGVLYNLQYSSGTATPITATILGPIGNMGVKLDATQTWRLRTTGLGGTVALGHTFVWTTNPK